MADLVKLYGPPGTGKTTWLINKLKETVDGENVKIQDVMFISFSNSAINEACERIRVDKGGVVTPYFRILHGLCLSWLTKQSPGLRYIVETMQAYDFIEGLQAKFCQDLGIPYIKGDDGSEALGNRIFTLWTRTIGEHYPKKRDAQACLDLLYKVNNEAGHVIELWLKTKEKTGIIDFNDMLIEAYEDDIFIDAKVGFIDEVQDFNSLEFEIAKKLIEGLDVAYLAGDDDQAIYGWKGARPEFFLNFKGEEHVLPKSWRVPSEIWKLAGGIISQVKTRKEKTIIPAFNGGGWNILKRMSFDEIVRTAAILSRRHPDKTVFLLFRTNKMVYYAERILISLRVPFKKLKGESPWDKEILTAWNVVAKLRGKQPLNIQEKFWLIENLREEILPQHLKEGALKSLAEGGLPIQFFEVLQSKGDPINLINFRSKRTAKIVQDAYHPVVEEKINLYVDTIHASKGKEADIVVLADAITQNIASELRNGGRESELRLFYVGVTRAKNFVIVAPLYKFRPFLTQEVVACAHV